MAEVKKKVGIIGCGTIGSEVAIYCVNGFSEDIQLSCLYDIDKEKASSLKKRLSGDILIANSLQEVIDRSDLIVETASVNIVSELLERVIEGKKDAIIMSTGGIIGKEYLIDLARKKGCLIYFPSGAICGLDGVKAASLGKVYSIVLTTKKPPQALKGTPYVEKKEIDIDSIKTESLLFEGSVSEAIKEFPKNINVAASLNLASLYAEGAEVRVKIVCVPESKKNVHEIELHGECGSIFVKVDNFPLPSNPKTSFLAALSALATIRNVVDSVRIGT